MAMGTSLGALFIFIVVADDELNVTQAPSLPSHQCL
jgi:hypothetical protein